MNTQDYIRMVRLLISISIIGFVCFALILNTGMESWGIPENLIKAYSEMESNSYLAICIPIFGLYIISYVMLWQLKMQGVYLSLISILLWWIYSFITLNIELSSAPLVITQALNEYTFVSAAVLTWVYNKNIKNSSIRY